MKEAFFDRDNIGVGCFIQSFKNVFYPTFHLVLPVDQLQSTSFFTHTNLSLLNFADEDECTADTTLCANGVCNNLVGMPYTCTCDSGYVDDGTGQACVGKNCQVLLHEFPK